VGDNYISINFPNFITITLMGMIGLAILGLLGSLYRAKTGGAA
jgi:hypothetical protein